MMNYNKERITIDLSDAVNISDLGVKITGVLEADNTTNKALYLKLGNIDLKQSQLLSIKALIEAMQSSLEGIDTNSEITETSAIGLGLTVGKPSVNQEPNDNYELNVEKSFEEEITSTEELNSFAQLKNINSLGDSVSDTNNYTEINYETPEKENQEAFQNTEEVEETKELTKEEKVANIYDSLNKEMTHEDIQDALDITFGTNFSDNLKTESEIQKEDNQAETNSSEFETSGSEDIFAPVKIQEELEEREITETIEKADEGKYVLLDTEGITPEGLELIKANTSDLDTLYLTQTLRSGQTVSYEGNIFLIGDAHPGSEINATGDITVWGILGGIVHAGTKGNTSAKVRALKLNPIQLRIANLYSRRNDTVNVPYVQKSNEFTPEEARIENEQIVIYKTLRRED